MRTCEKTKGQKQVHKVIDLSRSRTHASRVHEVNEQPMEKSAFISRIIEGAVSLGITLSEESADRLFIYNSELQRWNKKVNLVSRHQPDWVRVHFLDSLAPLGMGLIKGDERAVDLGSGAGFPGVALKVVSPGLSMELAETVGKKCAWLNHLVRTLELKGTRVLEGRFEDLLEQGCSGQYGLVVSRAAAKPAEISAISRRFLTPEGRALVYTTEALVPKGLGDVHPYSVPGSKVPSVIWEVGARELAANSY